MSRAETFAWLQKQFATSPTEIFNNFLFLLIGGRTCQWTLLQASQSQPIRKVTATTRYWSSLTSLQNGILQASQGHDWCTRSSRSDHRYGCVSPRSFGVNCDGSRLAIHIKVLVFALLLPRHQEEAIYSLPLSNRWQDWETKQHNGSVPQSICQLGAKWLGKAIADGGIYL